MNKNLTNLFISLALILVGGVFLAQNLGYLLITSPLLWTGLLGGLSVLFFITYFASKLQSWWWLFPAAILGAAALATGLTSAGFNSPVLGVPILAGISLPFFAAFAIDRQKNWWALIPGSVMGVIAIIPLIESRVAGEVIGSMVLFAIALPFLLIFLNNTSSRWALIPALALGFIGLIPLASLLVNEQLEPVMVMLIFAVPFLLVFAAERSAWWALIPAGVFASIGAGVLAGILLGVAQQTAVAGVMFLGWGLTFGVLWLLRRRYGTAWALYPAIACAGVALMILAFSPVLRFVWPLLLIAGGGYVLYRSLRPTRHISE